ASSLVLVDDLLVRNAVDDALRAAELFLRRGFVATDDGLLNCLDGSAQARTQTGVVRADLDGLTGALACLSRVGRGRSSVVLWCYETRQSTAQNTKTQTSPTDRDSKDASRARIPGKMTLFLPAACMNLLRALVTVSGMTLISRVLGFVRDFVIARSFGAGAATDAFFVAFRLPNLLRRMFAEGAFSQAFVPVLAEYRNQRGEEEAHALISRVATLLGLVVAGVSALGILAAPIIIYITAPGFSADAEKFALTVEMTRI